tara:strand:- start:653 stop:850 length:198 start_codon:yes stop_codon:yes gene_type:complete
MRMRILPMDEQKTTVNRFLTADDLYYACKNDSELMREIAHNYILHLDDDEVRLLSNNLKQNYGLD